MQDEVSLDVDARRPGQEINEWLDGVVIPAFTADHKKRSPLCQATKLDYLKLPVPEDGCRIGDGREGLH